MDEETPEGHRGYGLRVDERRKYNGLGEWDDDVDPAEWVPGDPLPGLWRTDWPRWMVQLADLGECAESCWCRRAPEYAATAYRAYRWTPTMPDLVDMKDVCCGG